MSPRALAVVALLFSACSLQPYRIVGYVYKDTDISRISAEKLTHINYAFGQVNANGEAVIDPRIVPARLAQLQTLKTRNPKLKIILSIGGWGADNFSDAAFNRTMREQFTASVIRLVKDYALDGIDLDWEYPGQPGPGIKYREEDKENFTAMLKSLREALDSLGGRHYTLTIASSGGPYFEHTEMDKLHVYLDWINIMTYDFAGEWSETTGHHAGLYPLADAFVKQHLAAGIPSRKLVLGVPFYGRGWCGVDATGRVEGTLTDLPFSRLAREFIDKNGFERRWDAAAHAPYLWNESSASYITYEDPQSIRDKARFIKEHRLGGAMYWEHGADPDEVLLSALYFALK